MQALPDVTELIAALTLERVGPGRWAGPGVASREGVVFAGQLIGQALVAATAEVPGKRVKSIHTVFARTGRTDAPVTLDVEPLHDGRSFAGSSVTARQGERVLARSLLLLDVAEDDVIRHQPDPPAVAGPERSHPRPTMLAGWDQRFPDDVDLFAPDAVGPPDIAYWSRFTGVPPGQAVAQALVTWASVGFFVGAAMRPHANVGLARAHRDLSTGVLTHALTFHGEIDAERWLLMVVRGTASGGGRAYGTGDAFTDDGRLVASYTQESLLRAAPTDRPAVL